ncbi:PIR protein, putative [Plasmodium sp.]|nr:PIR protein, putative [Plasmodium sp.]
MKVHSVKILLFALPLNILVTLYYATSSKNPYITLHTRTTRLLCECDLYSSINDNDPWIKKVMEIFDRQTSQRFHEYDERMIKKRKRCKEQCDKDIQKIILKDKIEKQLEEKFATLNTNINTKDIPTCVCKKSVEDKTERFCFQCGYGLGCVASNIGLLGGPGIYGWKIAALATAKDAAVIKGSAVGKAAGDILGAAKVIEGIKSELLMDSLRETLLKSFLTKTHYTDVPKISEAVYTQFNRTCLFNGFDGLYDFENSMCTVFHKLSSGPSGVVKAEEFIGSTVDKFVTQAKIAATAKADKVAASKTVVFEARNIAAVDTTYASCHTVIVASIVAILIIILIMVIIYLILRYRRKNKMKKKLQYIKLLKE